MGPISQSVTWYDIHLRTQGDDALSIELPVSFGELFQAFGPKPPLLVLFILRVTFPMSLD
jgi:hypothetical protein